MIQKQKHFRIKVKHEIIFTQRKKMNGSNEIKVEHPTIDV